jgi:hypothetical protein
MSDMLNFYAWKKQLLYFERIQKFCKSNIPLNEILLPSPEPPPSSMLFFIEDGIDELLEDFQKRSDKDVHQSNDEEITTVTEIFIENIEFEN